MGIVDKYVHGHINKKLVPVKLGFHNVARDMSTLHQNLSLIHQNSADWHGFLEQRSRALERDFADMKEQLSQHASKKVSSAVDALEDDMRVLQQELQKHKGHKDVQEGLDRLKGHLSTVFRQYNKHIINLHQKIATLHENERNMRKEIQALVREELEKMRSDLSQRPALERAPARIEQKSEPKQVQPLRNIAQQLTPSQKQLLAILASTDQHLSYKDLAAEYGKSPATVKTLLCNFRRLGVPVLEDNRDGMKRFYLDENFRRIILTKQL